MSTKVQELPILPFENASSWNTPIWYFDKSVNYVPMPLLKWLIHRIRCRILKSKKERQNLWIHPTDTEYTLCILTERSTWPRQILRSNVVPDIALGEFKVLIVSEYDKAPEFRCPGRRVIVRGCRGHASWALLDSQTSLKWKDDTSTIESDRCHKSWNLTAIRKNNSFRFKLCWHCSRSQ